MTSIYLNAKKYKLIEEYINDTTNELLNTLYNIPFIIQKKV